MVPVSVWKLLLRGNLSSLSVFAALGMGRSHGHLGSGGERATPYAETGRLGEDLRRYVFWLCEVFYDFMTLRHLVVLLYTCLLRHRRNLVINFAQQIVPGIHLH